MKKMVLVAMMGLATCFVNAGSVNWNTSVLSTAVGGTTTYTSTWQGQTVSFFLVSDSFTETTLISQLQSGTALASVASSDKGTVDLTKALAASPAYSASGTGSATFTSGTVVYGYAVVFSNDGTEFAISAIKSGTFGTANLTMAMGTTSWTVYTIVPEPTSLALLGFGVVALGLRRKFRK